MKFNIKDKCVYFKLIGLVTDTISSENYCETWDIPRFTIKAQVDEKTYTISKNADWYKFVAEFNQEAKKGKKELLAKFPPGLYVEDFGDNIGVHFYGLNNKGVMANGYPSAGGFVNGKGLGFQENNSHGFCQTFAIMHYLGVSFHDFKSGNTKSVWESNGRKALNFLYEFTLERPWAWSIDEIEENFPIVAGCDNYNRKEMMKFLRSMAVVDDDGDKVVFIFSIIDLLMQNDKWFNDWFNN